MIKVGIYGASGYMGGEVLRILNEHPEVQIAWATSRGQEPLEQIHRNLTGSHLNFTKPDGLEEVDLVFFAVPSGIVMKEASQFVEKGSKIIDLGSDFRIQDKETWENVYSKKHLSWDLAEEAIYGMPEFYRQKIKNARIVANPGCFSSSAIFGLAPLIKSGWIDNSKIVIDGISGTAGAGADLDKALHHPELCNNVLPYNVVDHRHTYEVEQELGKLTDDKVSIHFTPVYAPISRGILCMCHGFLNQEKSLKDLQELYEDYYRNERYIKVLNLKPEKGASWQYTPYPWVSSVSGTNYCQIGFDIDKKRGRVVVFSVLDSMGKGGSHAGVQNMNLMFGLDEHIGLKRYGLHPY